MEETKQESNQSYRGITKVERNPCNKENTILTGEKLLVQGITQEHLDYLESRINQYRLRENELDLQVQELRYKLKL